MATTMSIDVKAEVHYKIIYGVPEIEGIYLGGKDIYPSMLPTDTMSEVFRNFCKEILASQEPPLENEGTDWEGYARQGNESNLE